MVKKISFTVGLVLLAVFFIWRIVDVPSEEQKAAEELKIKEQVLQTDLDLSEKLCLHHCSAALQNTLLTQTQQNNDAKPEQQLNKLLQQNPNMKKLIWKDAEGEQHTVQTKGLPADSSFLKKVDKHLRKAESALKKADSYTSGKLNHGSHDYHVIAQKANDITITALISHEMMHGLAAEGRKNLRLVPYPSEQRTKLQSIDADTKQHVRVNHPEDNEGTSHYYDGEVVVRFHTGLDEEKMRIIEKDTGSKLIHSINETYIFRSNSMSTDELLRYFKGKNVKYVEPNYLYITNQTQVSANAPNDTLFSPYQWNLPAIDALHAWNVSRGTDDVIVAVLDTGVDLQHADLQGQLVEGINIVNTATQPLDDVGHGTHVAGIIAAAVNNNQGIAGLSWYNKIMPIKVLDSTGVGSTYAVAQGIIWATDNGAKVINMSLGNYAQAQFLHDAIRYAYERDVLLVAATGNDATAQPGYPAAYPEVLAVSATDQNRSLASFSNYGDYVDVVAPGVNIASTYPGSQYVAMSGTSMATPHVAALAAMIRSANPELTNEEVMNLIRTTANDLGPAGRDTSFGYGEINMASALGIKLQSEHIQQQEVEEQPSNWLSRLLMSIRNFIAGAS